MKDKTLYDKDSIQSLSPLEHVRLRPGMYVGSTKDSTQLLVELFLMLLMNIILVTVM